MPKESTREELELRDYLAALGRRWGWLMLPLLLFTLLAVVFTASQPLNYSATARVLLRPSTLLGGATELGDRDLLNEINLANSDDTTSLVRQRLNLDPTAELPEGKIESEPETDVLSFTFSGPTAPAAAMTSNVWADAYVELKQAEAQDSISQAVTRLQGRLDALREERSDIRADLERLENNLVQSSEAQRTSVQLQIERETSTISGDLNLVDAQIAANIGSITQLQLSGELASVGTADVFQRAAEPLDPTNASLSRNVAIGLLIGLLVGVGLALLVDNLDSSITDAEDIQRMGLTLLGIIPEAPRRQIRSGLSTVAQTHPGSSLADGYQKIRTALQFTTLGNDIKTILVTSPQQGDGKTTTATNLALALANVESRVVLADIDFRRPQIHTIFNTDLIPGISDALVGQTSLRQVAVNHPELSTTLVAMPAGTQPPNPATFLVSSRFSGLLADLRNQADLTILDAPPVLPVADAVSIASQADGVILVVRAGSTTHDELIASVESIRRSGGRLLGIVVNHARGKATAYGEFAGRRPVVEYREPAAAVGGEIPTGFPPSTSAVNDPMAAPRRTPAPTEQVPVVNEQGVVATTTVGASGDGTIGNGTTGNGTTGNGAAGTGHANGPSNGSAGFDAAVAGTLNTASPDQTVPPLTTSEATELAAELGKIDLNKSDSWTVPSPNESK